MAIREDLVASAAQFLQDPSVAAAPVENRIAFLKAKNLTEEEVQASLARAAGDGATAHQAAAAAAAATAYPSPQAAPPPGAVIPGQQPPPAYYGGYPPYGWQPPRPEIPRRDWRDWFIMATVVGGVSYGLYALGKRYVYPLIAPPTPERLESDKKSIDDSFEKAFALVDQLAKDTEALKDAEQQRTEKLDTALAELEAVINDLKTANRRREDEAQRVRDDVSNLKDSIPKALDAQKNLTDSRLQEVNAELKSLKTIVSQRMAAASSSTAALNNSNNSYTAGSRTPVAAAPSTPVPTSNENSNSAAVESSNATTNTDQKKPANGSPSTQAASLPSAGRSSPFSSGITAAAVKIPEWQRAMASKRNNSVSLNNNNNSNSSTTEQGSSSQAEASGSGA